MYCVVVAIQLYTFNSIDILVSIVNTVDVTRVLLLKELPSAHYRCFGYFTPFERLPIRAWSENIDSCHTQYSEGLGVV